MDSSIWFDTIHLGWFIVHIKGSQVRLCKLRHTSDVRMFGIIMLYKLYVKKLVVFYIELAYNYL